jgi:hypothetical protein
VRYSGCTQGLNPNEDGPRGALVVEVEDGRVVSERFEETSAFRWVRASIDVTGAEVVGDVQSLVEAELARLRGEAAGRPLAVRLDLTGRTRIGSRLADSLPEMLEYLREAEARGRAWVWLDRLRDLTRAERDIGGLEANSFAADLYALVAGIPEVEAAELVASLAEPALSGLAFRPELDLDACAVLERARDMALDALLEEGEAQ